MYHSRPDESFRRLLRHKTGFVPPRNGFEPGAEFHQRRWLMQKLVFLLTLMAFTMPAGFAVAGGLDGNRESMRQAWAAVQDQQKKEAAAEKDLLEKAKVALESPKAKSKR